MRVVLTDGTEIRCRSFKAIDSGVLLTKDKKRKTVVGFVPNHQLRYVLPASHEVIEPASAADTEADDIDDVTIVDGMEQEAATESTDDDTTAERDSGPVTVERSDVADAGGSDELRRLGGLGSTYADRLRSAGYERLADLAGADPVAVAEAASVPPGRGRRWVEAAGRVTASRSTTPSESADDDQDEDGGEDGDDRGEEATVVGDGEQEGDVPAEVDDTDEDDETEA